MEQSNNKNVWKISEILGFEVFNQSGEYLGVLYDVMTTGSNDIWVVRYYDEEFLIPALKTIVKEVNVIRKKIFVFLPPEYEGIFGKTQSTDADLSFNGYIVYED